jgi:hypothetical protein
MVVPAPDFTVTHVSTGQTTFDYTFRIFEDTDLLVTVIDDIGEIVNGLSYDVSGVNNPAGGSVVFSTEITAGYSVVITRSLETTQPYDFSNQAKFNRKRHEDAIDRVVMIIQQSIGDTERSVRVPVSDDPITELPSASERAGMVQVFDQDGNPTVADIADIGQIVSSVSESKTVTSGQVDVVFTNTETALASYKVGGALADGLPMIEGVDYIITGIYSIRLLKTFTDNTTIVATKNEAQGDNALTIDFVYENQRLDALQTVVTFAHQTTDDAWFTVGGVTLTPKIDYAVDSASQITLVNSYPQDTMILLLKYGSGLVATPNRAPESTDASASADTEQLVVIDLNSNVYDIDGDPLTFAVVDNVTDGTLVNNADGTFNYTSNAAFSGPDSFTYKVNDGALDSNVSTVSITVSDPNVQALIDDGWMQSPVTGHWFKYTVDGSDDWSMQSYVDSQAVAEGFGANLATVDSEAEGLWIANTWYPTQPLPIPVDPHRIEASRPWIGLTGDQPINSWAWQDNSPVTMPIYWDASQPQNAAGVDYCIIRLYDSVPLDGSLAVAANGTDFRAGIMMIKDPADYIPPP